MGHKAVLTVRLTHGVSDHLAAHPDQSAYKAQRLVIVKGGEHRFKLQGKLGVLFFLFRLIFLVNPAGMQGNALPHILRGEHFKLPVRVCLHKVGNVPPLAVILLAGQIGHFLYTVNIIVIIIGIGVVEFSRKIRLQQFFIAGGHL